MIRKIHILCLFFLLTLFIGTVSANEDANLTIGASSQTISLETSDVEMSYCDGSSFNVRFLDNDKVIVGEKLNITLNGVTYTRTTNSSGMAKLNINLIPGEYDVKTDSIFNNQKLSVLNTIKIKEMNTSFIGSKIMNLGFSEGKYTVTLVDCNNRPLTDKPIVLGVNGVQYNRTTNNLGQASLKINLPLGSYSAYASFAEGYYVPAFLNSAIEVGIFKTKFLSNASKLDSFNSKYSVRLIDCYDNPLADKNVLFSVNGLSSFVKTDENGFAVLNQNLGSGLYNVTFKFLGTVGYEGSVGYNMVEVISSNTVYKDPVLRTNDVDMFYKDGSSFNVQCFSAEGPAEGVKLNILINGVTYTRTTNSLGMAKLNINLAPGEYHIKTTCTVDNQQLSSLNTIRVAEMNATLIGEKVLEIGFKQGKYSVTLIGGNNTALSSKALIFSINGENYKRTTDESGRAGLNINLVPGNYPISVKFDEIFHTPSVINATVIVGKYDTKILPLNDVFNTTDVEYAVKIVDGRNVPVKNHVVVFALDKNVLKLTDENGIAVFKATLNPGTYKMNLQSGENIGYNMNFASYNFTVLCNSNIILNAEDFQTTVDNQLPFLVSLTNEKGTRLVNMTVKSDVYDGNKFVQTVESKTYEDGVARVVFDLDSGEYTVKSYVTPDSGAVTNKLTVKPASFAVDSKNLNLNRVGDFFTIVVKNNETGCPLANKSVVFSINSVNYKRTTNENGEARIQINLGKGNFIIGYLISDSPKYSDFRGSNTVFRFDGMLDTKVISTTEIIRKGTYFNVKLVDSNGFGLKNKVIYIKVNGIDYKRTTDEFGMAKLKVNLGDGKYDFGIRFDGDDSFFKYNGVVRVTVNTTPTFNYTLNMPAYISHKDYKIPILMNLTVNYGGSVYLISNDLGRNTNLYFDKNSPYFISDNGLESKDNFKQGLVLEFVEDNLLLTFFGKTADVGQFSVIFSHVRGKFIVNFIIDNKPVCNVSLLQSYEYDDYLRLVSDNYNFLTINNLNSTFTSNGHEFKRSVQMKDDIYSYSLKNAPKFDFDTIQTYLLTSEKINEEIMKVEMDKAFSFKENYDKYAYELYLSALMTSWFVDNLANNASKELNVTWEKKNQLMLVNLDWSGLTLDAKPFINVYGDEDDVKSFRLYYGFLFSLGEEFGLKATGNDALAPINEIVNGLYDGNDFVIDHIGDLLVLRLVNSSSSFRINMTSYNCEAYMATDINYITSNLVIKGSNCHNIISKESKIENIFGYALNEMKRSSGGIYNLFSTVKLHNVFSVFNKKLESFTILAGGYMFTGSFNPVAVLWAGINVGYLTIEYRNKYAPNNTWQYFAYHGGGGDIKTIAVYNNETGYIDSVEIPYDGDELNVDKACYIDSVYGKRDLSSEEKVKFNSYDNMDSINKFGKVFS